MEAEKRNTTEPGVQTVQTRIGIDKIIRIALHQGYALALWRLPEGTGINLLITQREQVLSPDAQIEEVEPGFIVSPFNPEKDRIFLPGEIILHFSGTEISTGEIPEALLHSIDPEIYHWFLHPNQPEPAQNYPELVEGCLEYIAQGEVVKLVASRSVHIPTPVGFDALEAFQKLTTRYPNAMVSLTSCHRAGTWLGATPELLVSVEDNQLFKTVALAGTQPYVPGMEIKKVAWTQKEIEEQALVERYIISCFKKIRLREYDENGPRTVVAGNLLHLKSEFTVDMKATNFPQLGSVMLKLLHPTSAVCGMPLDKALEYLVASEGYNRELYAGYLGPVNINRFTGLFVNLRCMQLTNSEIILYAGAGITEDSKPESEAAETLLKMNTLRQVILPE